jgi:ABC-type Fe3+-siderophore transport system permease subunit
MIDGDSTFSAETRLIPLVFPVCLGVLSTVLFGAAYADPYKFHWFVVVFAYCGSYFAFSKWMFLGKLRQANLLPARVVLFSVAASVAGQTYMLDCYPTRSGAVLTLICASRGVISFGLTYSWVELVPMSKGANR